MDALIFVICNNKINVFSIYFLTDVSDNQTLRMITYFVRCFIETVIAVLLFFIYFDL